MANLSQQGQAQLYHLMTVSFILIVMLIEDADEYAIYMLDDPNERPVLRYFAELELVFPLYPIS